MLRTVTRDPTCRYMGSRLSIESDPQIYVNKKIFSAFPLHLPLVELLKKSSKMKMTQNVSDASSTIEPCVAVSRASSLFADS